MTSESYNQNVIQSETTKIIKKINTQQNNDSNINLIQNHDADKEKSLKYESNINMESICESDRKVIISKNTKASILDDNNNVCIDNVRVIPYKEDDGLSNSEMNELNSYNSTPDR